MGALWRMVQSIKNIWLHNALSMFLNNERFAYALLFVD